jgi:hypothetical protein
MSAGQCWNINSKYATTTASQIFSQNFLTNSFTEHGEHSFYAFGWSIRTWEPNILIEDFCGLPKSLQVYAGIVPQITP